MQHEPGDEYLRRVATFIRNHEQNLAEGGFQRRRRAKRHSEPAPGSALNPLSWLTFDNNGPAPPAKPVVLSLDTQRLFYILIRLEAVGIDVGSLDVKVDSPSRPMSYINLFNDVDKSDAMSFTSFRSSFSAVSRLSLGGSWWGRQAPPTVDSELKYIYSSFTKLPALTLTAPGRKMIAELANDSPNENALPLNCFKNLQSLECIDIDPRTLLGWDRLADSLWSLTVKKSGVEDVSDIFIGAVLDDQARREGTISRSRKRKIGPSRQASFYSTNLPESVAEDEGEDDTTTPTLDDTSVSSPEVKLPAHKWAFLRHLCLADNALTFLPASPLPYLSSITHLDLSSNLLVSVPPGLTTLHRMVSLNLADNMIDSVLGIYTMLGQVLHLNLAHNRLESICGLERLLALERVDLRGNLIEESAEVGRLATLPNIAEVWVEGNPFMELEDDYRVKCFEYFWKEGKQITLDGSQPGFYEKRYMTSPPPEQMTSSRPVSTAAYSPPVVPVGHRSVGNETKLTPTGSPGLTPTTSPPSSQTASPHLGPVIGRGRRRKHTRIVDLDAEAEMPGGHGRMTSDGKLAARKDHSPMKSSSLARPEQVLFAATSLAAIPLEPPAVDLTEDTPPPSSPPKAAVASSPRPTPRSRHGRSQTSYSPSSTAFAPSTPPTSSTPPASQSPIAAQTINRRSATLSRANKAALRKARVSASVYEPPASNPEGDDEGAAQKEAEAFRARIEALRSDMGDGWLKVFSQTELETPRREVHS
ncbi:hypothetical protein JAAARDRAFT_159330 [Jaapia argillacea MUCL 33604]|uniref:Uncharacterized protein n=1 Tax=Jaapia argillacea MUCL 33604 TaxID=933084 RepID=A0A067PZV6_9AGAM|nr:hypothetical protein JAAARDRAFT_159330 [Jaapia argillacea MUCL 33604]